MSLGSGGTGLGGVIGVGFFEYFTLRLGFRAS